MKRSILFIFLSLCTSLCAQEAADSLSGQRPNLFADMPGAVVRQDSAVTRLLYDKITGTVRGTVEVDGFRVQIYSSNRQQTAKAEALRLEKSMTGQVGQPVYVLYQPPFWKVRLGDFLSIEEASAYKDDLLHRFPNLQSSTYVVRDMVQAVQ